jgi:hypothetical protein
MRHKTHELTGAHLDAAVAMANGWERGMCSEHDWWWACPFEFRTNEGNAETRVEWFKPSSDWSDGGPIVERERVCISPGATSWGAFIFGDSAGGAEGETPLIAAMRAFVISKLGEEIELP